MNRCVTSLPCYLAHDREGQNTQIAAKASKRNSIFYADESKRWAKFFRLEVQLSWNNNNNNTRLELTSKISWLIGFRSDNEDMREMWSKLTRLTYGLCMTCSIGIRIISDTKTSERSFVYNCLCEYRLACITGELSAT